MKEVTDAEITEGAARILGWDILPALGDFPPRYVEPNGPLVMEVRQWKPLEDIAHASLLVVKIREMPIATQLNFCSVLQKAFLEEAGGLNPFIILWLTPRAICEAAVEAVKGEKE